MTSVLRYCEQGDFSANQIGPRSREGGIADSEKIIHLPRAVERVQPAAVISPGQRQTDSLLLLIRPHYRTCANTNSSASLLLSA